MGGGTYYRTLLAPCPSFRFWPAPYRTDGPTQRWYILYYTLAIKQYSQLTFILSPLRVFVSECSYIIFVYNIYRVRNCIIYNNKNDDILIAHNGKFSLVQTLAVLIFMSCLVQTFALSPVSPLYYLC